MASIVSGGTHVEECHGHAAAIVIVADKERANNFVAETGMTKMAVSGKESGAFLNG